MVYTDQVKKAMSICFIAHSSQHDIGGAPYIFHPIHLAEQMTDELTTVVALLHDVVEDGPYTLNDLSCHFCYEVLEAINLLTHKKGIPYMKYIAAIKPNRIARTVKLADLKHNSDITRLPPLKQKEKSTLRRLEKYKQAIDLLESNERS